MIWDSPIEELSSVLGSNSVVEDNNRERRIGISAPSPVKLEKIRVNCSGFNGGQKNLHNFSEHRVIKAAIFHAISYLCTLRNQSLSNCLINNSLSELALWKW